MKPFLTSLRISIAGAKLSHLVRKDKIWDHGTMIEHVKTVFYHLEKEKKIKTNEILRKYMTELGYENYKKKYESMALEHKAVKYSKIKEIAVISVATATNKHPDLFTALIKGYKVKLISDGKNSLSFDDMVFKFSEEWFFTREGEWWLLDNMRSIQSIF